jgi:lipopolysaccharide cholinephosphotransferase
MDAEILRKLHVVELELLEEFVRICKAHNLEYFLIGGTLLGAIRHKGFIPWDDDIDIGMPRDDYEKFIDLCKTELKNTYYIKSYRTNSAYWMPFLKMCKSNTLFIEKKDISLEYKKNGIFIDIFSYDNISNIELFQRIQSFIINKIRATIQMKIWVKKGEKKNILKHLIDIIFDFKTLQELQQKMMTRIIKNNSSYQINWGGRYGLEKEIFHSDVLYPTTEAVFEGKYYRIPNQWNKYLSQIYGSDYMEIPSQEKREDHEPIYITFDTEAGDECLSNKKDTILS